MIRIAAAAAALVVALGLSPAAQLPRPLGYVAHRTTSRISVDGQLNDAAWKTARWSSDFVDIEGDVKPKPRHLTRMKMLWDQTYFYIGAELVEPHLWGTLTDHDSIIFQDNDFEIFIDPNGDNHEYYELEINALGTTWDLFLPKPYKDDGKALNGWEIAGMKSAVHLEGTLNNPRDTDRGWSVELALPWKALGEVARTPSPPRDGDQWRVNFSRVQWQLDVVNGAYRKRMASASAGEKPRPLPEFNWVWSPQGVIDMHRPERWGYVQFSSAAGTTTFVEDPSWPVRENLHAIYYAQRDYRKTYGRWAGSLAELQLEVPTTTAGPAVLAVAGDQFQASLGGWYIRQDSLIWKK